MKFVSLVHNFRQALAIAERAAGKSSHLPILGYFLIEGDKNKITISATNLELAIVTSFSGKLESSGKIAVPARTLVGFLAQVGDDKVEVSSEGKTLKLMSDHYRTTLQGLEPDEFPLVPKLTQQEPIKVESRLLAEALGQVITAASVTELRPELSGVLIVYEADRGLIFAATDGSRLAEKTLGINAYETRLNVRLSSLLPLKTAQEALRINQEKTGQVSLFIDLNQIEFRWSDTQLVSRLLEGEFPDYASVVPKEFTSEVTMEKRKVLEALRASSVFAGKLNDVRIVTQPEENKIVCRAAEASVGENEATIEAEVKGKSVDVAFNYKYLLDGFENIHEAKAFFGLGEVTSAAMIKPERDASFFYIVMPIRL